MIKKVILIFKIFICLIFSVNIHARNFCFSRDTNISQLKAKLDSILTKQDRIGPGRFENCIDIDSSKEKMRVIDKFLSQNYWVVSKDIETSSFDSAALNCHVTIEAQVQSNKNLKNLNLNNKNFNAVDSNSSQKNLSSSSVLITSGKRASVEIDEFQFLVGCKKRTTFFEIELFFQNQNSTYISTSVNVSFNKRVKIGDTLKKMKTKSRTLSVKPKVNISNNSGFSKVEYFLSVR